MVAVPTAAATGSASKANLTPLQRGLQFYRGKTLNVICPCTLGNTTDMYVRQALGPYLAAYLHANVNIASNGLGQGIPAQDAGAAATPDGLTIFFINELSDALGQLSGTPIINFNPEREEFIAGEGHSILVIVAASSSPYTNFAAIKNSPTPVKTLVLVPSAADDEITAFFSLMGVKASFVSGYSGNAALVTGFTRGDGPVTYAATSNFVSLIQGGQARPIAITGTDSTAIPDSQLFKGVPTFGHLLTTYPPKTKKLRTEAQSLINLVSFAGSFPILTQTSVANFKLLALRAAVKWAYGHPGFRNISASTGTPPKYQNPVQAKTEYIKVLATGAGIACYIKGDCTP